MTNRYRLLTSTLLLAGVLGLAVPTSPRLILDWAIVPAGANGYGTNGECQHTQTDHKHCAPLVYTHAVSFESGDFFDLGAFNQFEPPFPRGDISALPCRVLKDGTVVCGHNTGFDKRDPLPKINIIGLFNLWEQDDQSQGTPGDCFIGKDAFGNDAIGNIDPIIQISSGSADTVNVVFFIKGDIDTHDDGKNEVPEFCFSEVATVGYGIGIGPCFTEDLPFPPSGGGVPTEVTCYTDDQDEYPAADVRVKHEGGGKLGRKCSCEATGMLKDRTVIQVQSVGPIVYRGDETVDGEPVPFPEDFPPVLPWPPQ